MTNTNVKFGLLVKLLCAGLDFQTEVSGNLHCWLQPEKEHRHSSEKGENSLVYCVHLHFSQCISLTSFPPPISFRRTSPFFCFITTGERPNGMSSSGPSEPYTWAFPSRQNGRKRRPTSTIFCRPSSYILKTAWIFLAQVVCQEVPAPRHRGSLRVHIHMGRGPRSRAFWCGGVSTGFIASSVHDNAESNWPRRVLKRGKFQVLKIGEEVWLGDIAAWPGTWQEVELVDD